MVLRGVQTMAPDHGFTRVGTMHVQAIMPPLNFPDPNPQGPKIEKIQDLEIFKRD